MQTVRNYILTIKAGWNHSLKVYQTQLLRAEFEANLQVANVISKLEETTEDHQGLSAILKGGA